MLIERFKNDLQIIDNYGTSTNSSWKNSVSTADISGYSYTDTIKDLKKQLDELKTEINKKKEEKKDMKGFNFDFGPCNDNVRLSMYGLAVKNIAGEWVSYNPASDEIINVDIFNIADGGKYIYKMPVAISDVQVGDIVVHNKVPMFVTAIGEGGSNFTVIDVRAGESKTIIPTRSPFGFNFMTKVVSLFNMFSNAPAADQPFGNMLPFIMSEDGNIDPMVLMFMMNDKKMDMSNPLMMYMMFAKDKTIDPMMMMFMMNNNK